MTADRLRAFTDGVVAIIITVMVLGLKIPERTSLGALQPLVPALLTYVLSFVYLGIYWSNHHHMLHVTDRVNGAILWANLHLLFWLSLLPFATGWVGERHFATVPIAVYGVVLFMAAVAYFMLQGAIVREQGPGSELRAAIGRDLKGKVSPLIYLVAIPVTFLNRWVALGCYAFVALMWLVPDRRLEARFAQARAGAHQE